MYRSIVLVLVVSATGLETLSISPRDSFTTTCLESNFFMLHGLRSKESAESTPFEAFGDSNTTCSEAFLIDVRCAKWARSRRGAAQSLGSLSCRHATQVGSDIKHDSEIYNQNKPNKQIHRVLSFNMSSESMLFRRFYWIL